MSARTISLLRALGAFAALALFAGAAMAQADGSNTGEAAAAPEAAASAAIVGRALIETPGAEARLPLEMDAPGMVLVSFGADVADRGLEAEILNPLGESLGRNAAFNFLPGTVEIVVRDPRGAFARPEPVSVLIDVRPDADVLEPNSERHPASVRLNAWFENVLTPSDTDHFVFDVPEAGHIVVEAQGRQNGFDTAFRPAIDGAQWTGGAHYEAAAGRHILQFADRSGRLELEPFRFRIVWTPPQGDAPQKLALGTAVPALIARPGFVARFALTVPDAGLLDLSLMGDAPEQTVIRLTRGEEQFKAAPPLRRAVSPGTYDVEVWSERNHASPRPFHVLANLYRTTDAAEPNETLAGAVAAALDAPLRVVLYPETDSDWFRFDIPEAGVLTFLVEAIDDNRNAALNTLQIWAPAAPEGAAANAAGTASAEKVPAMQSVPRYVNRRVARLGPFAVSPGPVWLSSTVNYRGLRRMEFAVRPEFRPAGARDREGDQVFVIGLSLSDQAKAQMAAAMQASGGVYVDAANAEVLKARVEEVKRRADREARRRLGTGGGGGLWFVLVLLAAGGAGYWQRARLADMARTYGWLIRPELPEWLRRSLHKQ